MSCLFARSFRPALAALGIGSLTAPASANPADTYGLGSRAIALGGAVSSNARDFSANYYNPAKLAQLAHTELSVGLMFVMPALKLAGQRKAASEPRALTFGIAAPGSIYGLPIAFGLAAQLSEDRLSRVVTFAEDDQRWFVYDNRPEQVYLSANLAARPFPWLSVGAGYSFLASTSGTLQIRGTAVQPGFGPQTEFDSELEHEVRAELLSVRYPQAGIEFSPSEQFTVALVYRGEGQVALGVNSEIEGDLALRSLRIPTSYLLRSETIQSHVPQQGVLGVSYWPKARTLLSAELSWIDWSSFPSPLSATESELEVEEPPGLKLNVPKLPEATPLKSAGLRDRGTLRMGFEHQLALSESHALPLRAGYAFIPTGLTKDSSANLVDADLQLFSMGAGLSIQAPSGVLPGTLKLDVHGQWGLLPERTLAVLPRVDAENAEVTAGGHFVGAGLTLAYEFAAR